MAINTGYLTAERTAESNEMYTPYYAVDPILKYIPKDKKIWCPFDEEINNHIRGLHTDCKNIDLLSKVDAESIIEKWVKEHPVKTYESDFKDKINDLLKIFPNHKVKKFVEDNSINIYIYGSLCVADFYFDGDRNKAKCKYFGGSNSCKDCWKREIDE